MHAEEYAAWRNSQCCNRVGDDSVRHDGELYRSKLRTGVLYCDSIQASEGAEEEDVITSLNDVSGGFNKVHWISNRGSGGLFH